MIDCKFFISYLGWSLLLDPGVFGALIVLDGSNSNFVWFSFVSLPLDELLRVGATALRNIFGEFMIDLQIWVENETDSSSSLPNL